VNEIYKNESYDRVQEKVLRKVENIMRLRQQAFHDAYGDKAIPKEPADAKELERQKTIEKLNLYYDLLQIEIEKLRRKSIDEVQNS